MNMFLSNLVNGAKNVHISVPLILALGLEIVPIWFPQYKQQCSDTQKLLLGYGVLAAANSGPSEKTPPKP